MQSSGGKLRVKSARSVTYSSTRLRHALFVGIALFCANILSARADSCTLVNRDQAEQAVAALVAAGHILYENWFSPLLVREARWKRSGFLYQVEVNGDGPLNLSAVYVPGGNAAHFENLGAKLGCSAGNAPERIPRAAFSDNPVAAYAPDVDSWQPPRALEGLLELPELERAWYAGTQETPPAPVAAYAGPTRDAGIREQVTAITALPTLEYGYERPGAIVLEQRAGWYRIALTSGSGWVVADDAGAFHSVATLLAESLTHLTVGWDGRLHAAPAPSAQSRWLEPVWRRHMGGEIPVNVVETRTVADMLWLRIEITWPSPCSGDEPSVLATGWAPVRGAGDSMNVWFSSRGC